MILKITVFGHAGLSKIFISVDLPRSVRLPSLKTGCGP